MNKNIFFSPWKTLGRTRNKKSDAATCIFLVAHFVHHIIDHIVKHIYIFLVCLLRVSLFARRAHTPTGLIWQMHQIRFPVMRLLCWTLVFGGQASLFRLSLTGLLTDVDKQKCNTSAPHSSPQQKGGSGWLDGRMDWHDESGRVGKKKKRLEAACPLRHKLKQCSVFKRPFGNHYGIGNHEHAVLTLYAHPWLVKNKSHLSTLFTDLELLRGSQPDQTSRKSDRQSRQESHK